MLDNTDYQSLQQYHFHYSLVEGERIDESKYLKGKLADKEEIIKSKDKVIEEIIKSKEETIR